MSTWRGASNGAARGGSNPFASSDNSRGQGRGRGGAPRGAGRGGAGSSAFPRSSNLSWRAPVVPQQTDQSTMDEQDGQEEEVEQGDDGPGDEAQSATSAFSAFGSAPSAFGTPAFTGGATSSPFGGGTSVFGGSGTTSAFKASAFGGASSAFGATAFGSTSTPSAFSSSPALAPMTPAEPAPSKPTPSNQISTLEVLGEDSESRKKRFESSLANNRYLELKPLREAQRARDIKSGLIPDPLKPMRLDQATDFLGTCVEMCPEWEREEREYQNNVDALERYPGTSRIDPSRAVKAFHRPAAGNDQPLPSDVRPPHVLKSTLDYLFHTLLPTQPLYVTHPFLRDRTRAVRQDFTMQNERGVTAIECNERIARYHVLALGTLREQSGFSESQELEQLRKVLKSLNEFYDDARIADPPVPTPNEAEFRSYNILTHLRDPDIIWSTELLPSHVFEHPLLQIALSLHALAQRSNIPRGERASPNAASRFFKLVSRPEVPYLFGCILSTHFPDIRKNALEAMKNSYLHQHSLFPARTLAKVLGCDDEAEVAAVCGKLGFKTKTAENGRLVVELHKAAVMKNGTITPHVSQRLVEAKRGSTSYQKVIDGDSYQSGSVDAMPQTPSIATPPSFPAPPASRPSAAASPPTAFAPPARIQPPSAFSDFGAPSPAPPTSLPAFSAPLQPSAPPFAPSSAAPTSNPFAYASSLAPPSLNPIAPSFVPTRPPLPRFPSPQPPPSFSRPASALAPSAAAEETASRPVKKLPPPVIATSSAPAPIPRKPSVVAASPPPTTPRPDRRPLIKALSASLTDELLRYVVQFPVHRAVEQGLKERWELVRQREQKGRRLLADRIVGDVVEEYVRREVRRLVFEASTRDRACLTDLFADWRSRTKRKICRREEEAERARRFNEVAGDIGVTTRWEEEDGEYEEEEDGGLDMSSLSIGLGNVLQDSEPARLDQTMASRIKQAEIDRERIWTPGTFLDIVSSRVDSAFARHQLAGVRPTWSLLVSTHDVTSPFAAWLSCKFDLDRQTLTSNMDTGHADVEIQMVGDGNAPSDEVLNSAGLLVFDSSSNSLTDRQRLASLVAKVEQQSLFKPHLLVITPERPDTGEEQTRRTKILKELRTDILDGVLSTTLLFCDLQRADEQLAASLDRPLDAIEIRTERIVRPLSLFVEPLVRAWRESLRQTLAESTALDPHRLFDIFLNGLNSIIDEAQASATPAPPPLGLLPSLGSGDSPFRSKLRPYIQRPAFASAGHFPFVEAQISERPLVPEVILAKSLLEHLGNQVLDRCSQGTLRQQAIDQALPVAIQRLRSSLQSSVSSLFNAENAIGSPSPKKKRKASLGPPSETSHKKRVEVTSRDSLSALNLLLQDARSLLA